MDNKITIHAVKDSTEKADIVAEVLSDLPEWFGLPDSTKEYIENSKNLPLWTAESNGNTIGFITLTNTSEQTAEIYCMGVKKAFRHQGIGQLLYSELEKHACQFYTFIQVKTVDEGHYQEYDQTIHFYEKIGFSRFEVFPTLWDEWNPCLILIKSLTNACQR